MEISLPGAEPPIALVSMPWMSTGIPSIQLATLAAALHGDGIASEVHELFLDYAASVGPGLYKAVSNAGGFVEEWLFAQHYFGAETGDSLAEFRAHRPEIGLAMPRVEDLLLDALVATTGKFLAEVAARDDWSRYDIIGFSLTISQTAPSMALARLLKQRHPGLTIVFGGSACAGPMGPAILRICPYVDAIVGGDGEPVVAALVRALRRGEPLAGIAGVTWRSPSGRIVTNPGGRLLETRGPRPPLSFDGYFARLERLGLRDHVDVWLPFESSRGCWYGEKNQCTFCGLHEIMAYRSWTWESVLGELEAWERRYGVRQFFSVDLIMPRDYLSTFLPEVVRRGHAWTMFYAIKANMKRAEVEALAAAGVRWIQPGIESLDGTTLELMNKGVTPLQNIQLLKWCEELGIRVTWNIIIGIPGQPGSAYAEMAALAPSLYHLPPPTGVAPFELHRFSPLFERPEEFAIELAGAYPLYKYIFPIATSDLDDLVYRHDYRLRDPLAVTDPAPLHDAVAGWYDARERAASLTFALRPDGTAEISDRRSPEPVSHALSRGEAILYQSMDAAVSERALLASFAARHPEAMAECAARAGGGGGAGIAPLLERWVVAGLVLRSDGKLLALAVNPAAAAEHLQRRVAGLRASEAERDGGDPAPRRLPVVGRSG
jgi:ribosomal peptide maturation radical SAM protein 1